MCLQRGEERGKKAIKKVSGEVNVIEGIGGYAFLVAAVCKTEILFGMCNGYDALFGLWRLDFLYKFEEGMKVGRSPFFGVGAQGGAESSRSEGWGGWGGGMAG